MIQKVLPFPVYKYLIVWEFVEPALFPSYKGSTLRGAFGITFKDIVCVNRKIGSCRDCFISPQCAYKHIFEPDVSKGAKTANIPAPFILEPPYDKKREYKKGDIFTFWCILIGRVVDYFPYFVLSS